MTMKKPGFGMESRAGEVVRDSHIGAEFLEFIERAAFSRTGIRGREYT
jgi:hypothetical protein